MKITKKLIVFTAAQVLFSAVAPLVFIFTQYGDTRGGLVYKLPLGLILLAVIIVIVAKNTFLKPRLNKLAAKIAQHDGDLRVESDAGRIANLETELKRERTVETALNAVTPILLLAAMFVACKAMESAMLQLSGAIGFTLASYAVGTVFGIFAAREVRGKHGGDK